MKRSLLISASLVFASLAGCSGGGGPPPNAPVNPFGTEPPTVTGAEPTATDNEAPSPAASSASTEQLCAQACARVDAVCPAASGGASCASQCSTVATMGCETEFRAFVSCIATAPLSCQMDQLQAPACAAATQTFETCVNGAPNGGMV
jgi:hypothetical protein